MSEKFTKTAVLTGGGTAGHCIPALAVAEELKRRGYKCEYIGSENGMEKKLAQEKGLPYHGTPRFLSASLRSSLAHGTPW